MNSLLTFKRRTEKHICTILISFCQFLSAMHFRGDARKANDDLQLQIIENNPVLWLNLYLINFCIKKLKDQCISHGMKPELYLVNR